MPYPNDLFYASFSFILAAFILLSLWTLYSYCTIYYGKNEVNKLTFRPFRWAALTLIVKLIELVITLIELPYFVCVVKYCS